MSDAVSEELLADTARVVRAIENHTDFEMQVVLHEDDFADVHAAISAAIAATADLPNTHIEAKHVDLIANYTTDCTEIIAAGKLSFSRNKAYSVTATVQVNVDSHLDFTKDCLEQIRVQAGLLVYEASHGSFYPKLVIIVLT